MYTCVRVWEEATCFDMQLVHCANYRQKCVCIHTHTHTHRELQRQGAEIYSKPLVSCGLKWRLKVYPVSLHYRPFDQSDYTIARVLTGNVTLKHSQPLRMAIVRTLASTWECLWS